jgi:nicotinamidase-related amidase
MLEKLHTINDILQRYAMRRGVRHGIDTEVAVHVATEQCYRNQSTIRDCIRLGKQVIDHQQRIRGFSNV